MELIVVYVLLYILAAACFFAYALNLVASKVNLLGLGVFFWALVPLLQTLQKL